MFDVDFNDLLPISRSGEKIKALNSGVGLKAWTFRGANKWERVR